MEAPARVRSTDATEVRLLRWFPRRRVPLDLQVLWDAAAPARRLRAAHRRWRPPRPPAAAGDRARRDLAPPRHPREEAPGRPDDARRLPAPTRPSSPSTTGPSSRCARLRTARLRTGLSRPPCQGRNRLVGAIGNSPWCRTPRRRARPTSLKSGLIYLRSVKEALTRRRSCNAKA
jgi:hypothetical protein